MSNPAVHLSKATFTISAPDIRRLPEDTGIEVAFAGRSNAGKSSALNTLTNQKSLARTSKTPGRTQLINLFKKSFHKHLIQSGLVLTSSDNQKKMWAVLNANDEYEVKDMLCELPLTRFMNFDIRMLTFFNSVGAESPVFSLN